MEYVILELNYMNKDDGNMRAMMFEKVSSLEDWKEQVYNRVRESIESGGSISISHSDNIYDEFHDAQELLEKITFTSIDENDFKVLAKYLQDKNTYRHKKDETGQLISFKVGNVPYDAFNYNIENSNKQVFYL